MYFETSHDRQSSYTDWLYILWWSFLPSVKSHNLVLVSFRIFAAFSRFRRVLASYFRLLHHKSSSTASSLYQFVQ